MGAENRRIAGLTPIFYKMTPNELVETVYLGDRACKKIVLDGWNRLFAMQIDCISRLKEGTVEWNFYNDENIDDGWIVFENTSAFALSPAGAIPDDLINSLEVTDVADGKSRITVSVSSSIGGGLTREAVITLISDNVSLLTNSEFLNRIR